MALTACEQRWSFVHVRDVAAAFRYVLEDAGAAGIFNVAGPDAPPLRKTLECLRDLIDPAATLGFGDIGYRPDQVMVLEAETGRLRATGWQPRIDLERGLRETIAWYAHDHKH
jgi:nucleoside-diphosphate-sugar epimerase